MAIRETWHRMVRKSFSSSSSTARSDDGDDTTAPAGTTAGTSPTPSVPLSKTSSRLTGNLSKITSWRSNASHNSRHHAHNSDGSNGAKENGGSGDSSSRKASPKRDSPPKSILKKSGGNGGGGGFGSGFPRRLHPSERPLTEQNLRHQEMLGTFTMKFGRSRRFSRGARSSFSGISPRCSVDSSAGAPGWGDDNDGADGGAPGYHGRASSAAVAPDEARIAEESS
ncbi:hypothetical protein SLS64_013572 [Diaporthe eres]|uniref:Uncharacterized protein n=1 Tax=Diaporthe eres TaxID=83184 RepID=A0ABR1P4W3_DIAER